MTSEKVIAHHEIVQKKIEELSQVLSEVKKLEENTIDFYRQAKAWGGFPRIIGPVVKVFPPTKVVCKNTIMEALFPGYKKRDTWGGAKVW
jgi:hypothetical protein